MAKTANESKDATPSKPSRQRSPNFPAIGLREAVGLLDKMHATYKMHPVPLATLYQEWKLKETSSAGSQRIAALRAYGLIDVSGSGKGRKASVSKSGQRISGGAPDRDELLKTAALRPAIFRELWSKYERDGLPPDNLIAQYLKWEREGGTFTEDAIGLVIANLKATIEFAKVAAGDIIGGETDERDDGDSEDSMGDTEGPARLNDRQQRPRIQRGSVMPDNKAREEVFVVPEGGEIVLQFPGHLSQATFDDLQDWLKITVRKIGRLVRHENREPDKRP